MGLSATLLGLGAASVLGAAPAKAPLPTVLLYPASSGDVAALVDLRTRLRLDGHVEVLTYDPSSAAIQRASAEDAHPEWLVSAPATDEGRMFLARALGANFYAVVSPGRAADSTHVELVETAPAARTFDWTGTNRQFGVRAMESQVADSVSHPVTYTTAGDLTASGTPPPDAPVSGAALDAPIPSPVSAAPVPAPAPVPVIAAPAPIADMPAAVPAVLPAPPPVAAAAPILAPPVVAAVPAPVPAPVVADVPASVPAVIAVPAPVIAPAPVAPISVTAPVVVASAPPVAAPIKIALPNAVPPAGPASPAPVPAIKNAPIALSLPPLIAQAVPPPVLPPPLPASAAALSPKPVIAPQVTPPLPKVAAAVPLPKIATAVPAPQMAPLPAPAVPQVAAVMPKPALAAPVPPAVMVQKPTQIAALPKREIPAPSPFAPETVPSDALKPAMPSAVKKMAANAEDMTAIAPLLAKGDSALDGGDAVSAIAFYRQAINGAPLSVVPRLKLASAYQKDGLNDRALDEARRALQIAPDSLPVQQFLSDLDQQTGTTSGTLVRVRAALEQSPANPSAHAALADALWNNGDLSGAEAEYKAAAALAPAGSHLGDAQLAQLYAAEARYGDCLAILQSDGGSSYAVAIKIVKNRADTLSSTLASSRETFAAGKETREQFYDDAKKLSAQAQALAEFVAEVTPPAKYKLSHLHRTLSTNLLAQESAALVAFIETGDSEQNDTIAKLERAAGTEMLTAQATEEKLGLWKQTPQ